MGGGSHQYDVLPRGRWFRQLHIHPGKHDDPLNCELVTVALDQAPSYRALSYVWGDPTQVESIICAGSQRQVTVSLFEGLRRIRSPNKVEAAWADAICINQSDNIEKAQQVNLMGVIYDKASEVVVWLGEDSDHLAEAAFTGLANANSAIKNGAQTEWMPCPREELSLAFGSGDDLIHPPNPAMKLVSTMTSILSDKHLVAIKKLYELTWFTRVWVLQEVGLATTAVAFWGDARIAFSEIVLFIHYATSEEILIIRLGQEIRDVISGSPYYAFYNVWSTYDKKGGWLQSTPVLKAFADKMAIECKISFVLVLEASRRLNATNPLDHVFAFLGHPKALMPTNGLPLIQADYGLSLENLHLMVASSMAKESLNFLVLVQNTTQSLEHDSEIPSWIPRWNINDDDAPVAFWEAWDASLGISRKHSLPTQVSANELTVQALLFDTVELQTSIMREADFNRFSKESGGAGGLMEKCWNLTERAAETSPHAYGNDSILSLDVLLAFVSTLTCRYKRQRMEPKHLIEDFLWYCGLMNEHFFTQKLQKFVEKFNIHGMILPISQRVSGPAFTYYGTNRRFFVTKGRYWGLGPPLMQEGDVCAILFGGDVPFVLRPTPEEGKFRLVGQAYIYGAMYGQVVKKCEGGDMACSEKTIHLV